MGETSDLEDRVLSHNLIHIALMVLPGYNLYHVHKNVKKNAPGYVDRFYTGAAIFDILKVFIYSELLYKSLS